MPTLGEDNRLPTHARERAFLENFAKRQIPITYQDLAKALQILPPHSIQRVTEALERLMEEDAAADRPFIAALAISTAHGGLLAPGFFDCARRRPLRGRSGRSGRMVVSRRRAELRLRSLGRLVRHLTNKDIMFTEINPTANRGGRLSRPLVNYNGLSRCPAASI
jgi:hypothetical protein